MTRHQGSARAVVSPPLWLAAATISIATPLIASSLHAGRFLGSLGETPLDRAAMLATSFAIIASSVIIGNLAGRALARGHHGAFTGAAVVWLGILAFSTSTSTLAILNTSGERIQSQVAAGSETRAVQASLDANLASIASLQQQIDAKDPVRWASKRATWAEQIARIQRDNQSYLRRLQAAEARGSGSAVAQSFASLEQYGITRTRVAMLSSFLLDAIPFVVSVLLGLLGQRREAQAPGKPRRRPAKLHAVA